MADITVRTIGYICPHCRQSVITDRSPFQLTASASCEIPCPCGTSSLKIEYLLDRFRITSPCLACGEVHTVTCPAEAFLSRKALAFSCHTTGMDCCYVGEEGAVYAAMARLEQTTDQLKKEEQPGAFLNELVMREVLSELKDIAARDGISCQCGSRRWRMEIHYASVELICAACGSAMRINAATLDDLSELCCHPTLRIRSSK